MVNDGATLILDDAASVDGNTAVNEGGGVYVEVPEDKVYVCSAQVAISPNSPDDPPATLPCPARRAPWLGREAFREVAQAAGTGTRCPCAWRRTARRSSR